MWKKRLFFTLISTLLADPRNTKVSWNCSWKQLIWVLLLNPSLQKHWWTVQHAMSWGELPCHFLPSSTSLLLLPTNICSDFSNFSISQNQMFSLISTCKYILRESQQPRREFPFYWTGTTVKPFRALKPVSKYTFLPLLISCFSQPWDGKAGN